MTWLNDALEWVKGHGVPSIQMIGDRQYCDRQMNLISPPLADALDVATLQSLADYLLGNRDNLETKQIIIHISDPKTVTILGSLNFVSQRRPYYIQSDCPRDDFKFGQWMDQETFIINMQAQFVQDIIRDKVITTISKVQDAQTCVHEDDGLSQIVATRAGTSLLSEEKLPNPVSLAPYRTFSEVEQPASQFILRVRKGQFALFEADGGSWKLAAIENIKKWLKENLPEEITVIG